MRRRGGRPTGNAGYRTARVIADYPTRYEVSPLLGIVRGQDAPPQLVLLALPRATTMSSLRLRTTDLLDGMRLIAIVDTPGSLNAGRRICDGERRASAEFLVGTPTSARVESAGNA
jgi:hypothetical protein